MEDVAALFKALGDVTRQRLLQVLQQQELNVSELVQVLGQPQSTISRHLRVLRDAELLADRRDGTNVLYEATLAKRNGRRDSLRGRLGEWMEGQPLPRVVAERLKKVLRDRQKRSEGYFGAIGHRWDQIREEHFGRRFHLESLIALLSPEWTVADVGAGTGYLLPVLGRTFKRVIAVDPVPEMLAGARCGPELQGLDNISFREGGLDGLPIEDESVDLALAILVLHHVASPPAALGELGRILRAGGRLLIVEQAAHELKDFYERMQDRWWGFDPQEMVGQVTEAGFTDVRHRPLPTEDDRPATGPDAPELFVLTARKGCPDTRAWSPEVD